MTEHAWAESYDWSSLASAPLLFLDIEVKPDAIARRLARRTSGVGALYLREVTMVALLSCQRRQAGDEWGLRSYGRDDLNEADILSAVDAALVAHRARGGILISYNGTSHDLPLLRARQVRWRQCNREGIRSYLEDQARHVDVMLSFTRGGVSFGTLADACASVGLALFGPVQMDRDRELSPQQVKAELDVIGTAITFFHVLGDRIGSNEVIGEGLESLGSFLRAGGRSTSHLQHLATNPALLNRKCLPRRQESPMLELHRLNDL